MYLITATTDGKFLGHQVKEPIEVMRTLFLGDFAFKPISAIINGNIIILANPNYVIELNKEFNNDNN